MGTYSDVMISVTQNGYEKIKKDQEKFADYELLKLFEITNFESVFSNCLISSYSG